MVTSGDAEQPGRGESTPTIVTAVDEAAVRSGFSGVVRIDRADRVEYLKAFSLADRRHEVPNAVDTQFALASGAKGFTALTVASLIEEGALGLDTRVRSILGDDLPLITDDVTVEHLLAHRSGIGDYLDEAAMQDVTDHVLPGSMHELATTEQYVPLLGGHPTVFPAGERFAYNNGGFVVLALVAERVGGLPFHELVRHRVTDPAGMVDTGYLRSDELPRRAAVGYLEADAPRTNVFHLPVRGSGDGGIFSTAADLRELWVSLFDARIVSRAMLAEMVRPRSEVPAEEKRYGLGFWLHRSSDLVMLEGYDAGVSFRSVHDPGSGATYTVISNTSEGAWPMVELLDERFPGA
jgi:CubicO group peptidase (beta-lactamase class C family)